MRPPFSDDNEPISGAPRCGNGPTPEALLSFYLDRLTPAPFEPAAYEALLAYLRGGPEWTGTEAQLRVKAPGLLHLIVGSSEYQLV